MSARGLTFAEAGERNDNNRRQRLHAAVLSILAQAYDVRTRCVIIPDVEWLLSRRPDASLKPGAYQSWTLTDNGGEYNLELLNDEKSLVSVPYTTGGAHVDPGTVAHRLMQVLHGDEIDYEYREDPTIAEVYGGPLSCYEANEDNYARFDTSEARAIESERRATLDSCTKADHARKAIELLKQARSHLRDAGATKTLARCRRTLSSAYGALRHTENEVHRDKRRAHH